MQKQIYVLAPVEVVKVTSQNLAEVAEWCGGKVASAESRKVPGRMDSYVWVPTPGGTKISWAFPGMFVTKRLVNVIKKGSDGKPHSELKATWAVYRRDYFEQNYFESHTDAIKATWDKESKPKPEAPKPAAPKTNQAKKWQSPTGVDAEPEVGKLVADKPLDLNGQGITVVVNNLGDRDPAEVAELVSQQVEAQLK